MKSLACAMLIATAVLTAAPNAMADEGRAPEGAVQVADAMPRAESGPAQQGVHMVSNDGGGDVVIYAQRVARIEAQPTLVVFNGACSSACTLFLSLPSRRTCIMPGASFQFHQAYGASRDMNQWGSDYLMRRYPQWVRSWIARHGGLQRDLIRMDYAYAARFIPTCRVAST